MSVPLVISLGLALYFAIAWSLMVLVVIVGAFIIIGLQFCLSYMMICDDPKGVIPYARITPRCGSSQLVSPMSAYFRIPDDI